MQSTVIPSYTCRRAFTLVELMVVVVLMGIVAVTAIPTMGNVRSMREGAARDDVARLLEVAKARALAIGSPCGLQVNVTDSTLTIVQLDDASAMTSVIDPLTSKARSLDLHATYPDVTIDSMVNGDGSSGSGVIWFDYEATPHTRSLAGVFVSYNTEAATIELSSGRLVLVHPHTGVVEAP